MIKGTILYIIALYLLGQAVSKLMEEQYNEGFANGRSAGWFASRSPEALSKYPIRDNDVQDTSPTS